jgi:hypothetical protein
MILVQNCRDVRCAARSRASLRSVGFGILKLRLPDTYRQRSYKALSLAISELALHPTIPAGDATTRIPQEFKVAEWRSIWIIKRHVSPHR